jgi:hypothetical protein
MELGPVIIPSPADDFVGLTRHRKATGAVFRKHILNLGDLIHPQTGKVLTLDEPWFDRLKSNFDAQVCPIVQLPLADSKNEHDERPDRNLGEVIDIERSGKKVYAIIDVRGNLPDGRPAAPEVGKTLLGTSAFLHMNYTDTRTGRKVGPALLHACITNRPYVTDLDDYEPVIAATAAADMDYETIVLTQEEQEMPLTRDELLAQLKSEYGIDVPALQAQASHASDTSELTAALTAALSQTGRQMPDEGTLTLTDLAGAIAELASDREVFLTQVGEMKRDAAVSRVDRLVSDGYVLPSQKDGMVELALTNPSMFESLVPAKPVVAMNDQRGSGGTPHGEDKHTADVNGEIARLTSTDGAYAQHFVANGNGRRRR